MMNKKEKEIFSYFMKAYKRQYDGNMYNRTNYDEDLEFYLGYRNANKYPLAYNESFNKILPIIYSLLSRFMDQLYQSGNIVSVKPRKKKDVKNAKSVEAILNYQLESLNDIDMQGGSYLTMMKWFFNTITFGKGIAKVYWRKEDRISPKRVLIKKPNFDRMGNFQGYDPVDYVTQEMQTAYDGPYVEILHNKLFIPDIEYKSIQLMPAAFVVYKRSMDYVRKQEKKGVYKNIKDVGWPKAGGGGAGVNPSDSDEAFMKSIFIEGVCLHEQEIDDERKSPDIDILEGYGKAIMDGAPYEVGSGYKIKGEEKEVIVHIGNYHTILSLQENVYNSRPLFDMGCYFQPELFWDVGLVRLTKGIQEQYNNLANLRMQNAMMMVNAMIRVDPDSDVDPEALQWKPFGIVPAERGEVEPLTIPDFHSSLFMEQESFYDNSIQDLTGMYSYQMGRTPERQERVGVVYGIQAMGEARAKLMLMSMDYLGIRPLLKYMMILNTFHLPTGFEYRVGDVEQGEFGNVFGEDIHPDFDFAARYTSMEPALGKQFRAQQLVQMAQLWAQHPWINQYQYTKLMMELMDIREADTLIKTPQQMMQEMQQKTKMQMMMAQKQQQAETGSKIAIEDKKIQGKLQLGEQDFVQDAALLAIESELEDSNPNA